jgi:DNA-binding HxlR family transcriptional regulator
VATNRSYGDRCGIARALDLIGERWALLIVRELLLGPKRFTDLRSGLPKVSADVLAERLRELEQSGVVSRRTLPPPAGSRVYELTDRGRELEPVLLALGRWGSAAPFPSGKARLGVDAFVIALEMLFSERAADGLHATYELDIEGQPFSAQVDGGRLELSRGEPLDPDAVIQGGTAPLATILWHGATLSDALSAGTVELLGDRRLGRRFFSLFEPAAPGR